MFLMSFIIAFLLVTEFSKLSNMTNIKVNYISYRGWTDRLKLVPISREKESSHNEYTFK